MARLHFSRADPWADQGWCCRVSRGRHRVPTQTATLRAPPACLCLGQAVACPRHLGTSGGLAADTGIRAAEQEPMRWRPWEKQLPGSVLGISISPLCKRAPLRGAAVPRWVPLTQLVTDGGMGAVSCRRALRGRGQLRSSPARGTGGSQPPLGRCPHPGLSLGDAVTPTAAGRDARRTAHRHEAKCG